MIAVIHKNHTAEIVQSKYLTNHVSYLIITLNQSSKICNFKNNQLNYAQSKLTCSKVQKCLLIQKNFRLINVTLCVQYFRPAGSPPPALSAADSKRAVTASRRATSVLKSPDILESRQTPPKTTRKS